MAGDLAAAVDAIVEARRSGAIANLSRGAGPGSLEQAYAIQRAATERWSDAIAGWKVGATSRQVQDLFGIAEPVYGPVFAAEVFDSPARVPAGTFRHRMLESEFAFRFGEALPRRSARFARDEIAALIDAVIPAFKIISPRFERLMIDDIPALVADFCANGGAVLGRPCADWQKLDLAALPVSFAVDGVVRQQGTGAAVLGHPMNVLAWFVDIAQQRQIPITRGQFVLTGTMTGIHAPEPDQTAAADFDDLGTVQVIFERAAQRRQPKRISSSVSQPK